MQPTDARLLDLAILAIAAAALAGLGFLNGYIQFIFGLVAIWTILSTGLNVFYGLTGLVSLGQVGFFAVGAYAHAVLVQAGVSFWLALPGAAVVAALVGCVLAIPAVRMGGPFLAMVTIAFAFIIEHVAIEWRGLTGGQNGLFGFAQPAILGHTFSEANLVRLAIVIAALGLLAYRRLATSGWGIAMAALRDQEISAGSLGYDPIAELAHRMEDRMEGVRAEITRGQAHHAIIEFAVKHGHDCIVIGSHKPGLVDYFIGSTAARVVRHAPCAVHVHRDS